MMRRIILTVFAVISLVATLAACSSGDVKVVTRTVALATVTQTVTPGTPTETDTPTPPPSASSDVQELTKCKPTIDPRADLVVSPLELASVTTTSVRTAGSAPAKFQASFPLLDQHDQGCNFMIRRSTGTAAGSLPANGEMYDYVSTFFRTSDGKYYCYSQLAPKCTNTMEAQFPYDMYDVSTWIPKSTDPATARKISAPDCSPYETTFAGQTALECEFNTGTIEIVYYHGLIYDIYSRGSHAQEFLNSIHFTS